MENLHFTKDLSELQSDADVASTKSANAKASKYLTGSNRLRSNTLECTIGAPSDFVWSKLTNFEEHSQCFKRLKSTKVLRRDGNFVYLEVILKRQLFISKITQHTIAEVDNDNKVLRWRLLDGNFRAASGLWQLLASNDGKITSVRYTLSVNAHKILPPSLVSTALRVVQGEVLEAFKKYCESSFAKQFSRGSTGSFESSSTKCQALPLH